MKLHEIGEFGYIDRIAKMFRDLSAPGCLGIGDDCAVIPFNDEEDYVVTTDLLVEDIHFLKDCIAPEELGHKSLAVNLSDIAAMGAKPVASFLSVGIPDETDVEYLDSFMNGYHRLSEKYEVLLLGGDTTKSKKYLTINVGVIGRCNKGSARLRSMAQNNDVICVTGCLGDSAGGLEILLRQLPETKENLQLVQCHHLPEPHVNEGLWLAKHTEVHAMIDISDGLSSDLFHILKSSRKSAMIDIDKIPVSETLRNVSLSQGWDLERLITSGGEDYVLLFTINADSFKVINAVYKTTFGNDLYPIGKIFEGESCIKWIKNDEEIAFHQHGFNHFNKT